MEAQGITAHLLFLLPLRHKQSTAIKSPSHHHFPLHQVSSFHESLSLCDFHLALLHFATGPCIVLIIYLRSPGSLPFIPSLHLSRWVFNKRHISQTHPRLHLLSSYLLILPSVSIRADCCHFRPIRPCISFSFPPSLSTTEFPLSFSIHLTPGKKTDATALTPSGDGAVAEVGWSAPLNHFAPQLLVKEATDSVAVNPRSTCDLLDTGDKNNPSPWLPSHQKDTFCIFHMLMREKSFFAFTISLGEIKVAQRWSYFRLN